MNQFFDCESQFEVVSRIERERERERERELEEKKNPVNRRETERGVIGSFFWLVLPSFAVPSWVFPTRSPPKKRNKNPRDFTEFRNPLSW